jgi:hypothetical protein
MNVVNNTWRQLVRNKLWPVAVLLLAALVAVPVLLVREPAAPAPLAPLAVSTEADDTIAEPIVAKVTAEDRDRRRRVLGARKDPFAPAPQPKAKKADVQPDTGTGTGTDVGPPAPVDPGMGGGTVVGGGGEPAPEKRYYEAGTIIVRFGEATTGGELQRFAINKFEPVPDDELPLLVYMGLTKDGKKAKFLVDAAIEVDGDGDCKPHRSSCEVIQLAVGETEFLDVINPEAEEVPEEEEVEDGSDDETETVVEEEDEETEPSILATYQLDIVDIKRAGDDDVR